MKRNKLILIIVLLLLVTGCFHKKPSEYKIKSTADLNNKSGSMTCSRKADADSGVTPSFKYYITYRNNEILVLHSIEKITAQDSNYLNQYEQAYKNINKNYKGLNYYDSKVIRTNDSVTRDTVINYEKIDTDKLLSIEGEEDNIIKNGKAKLNTWLSFARKFGTICHED